MITRLTGGAAINVKILMIFQHFLTLMSQKTAEENVAFALKHSGLSKGKKRRLKCQVIDGWFWQIVPKNYPSQLYGGQNNVWLALANDPKSSDFRRVNLQLFNPKTT